MKLLKCCAALALGASIGGSLVIGGAASAGEPSPTVVLGPHSRHLESGQTTSFIRQWLNLVYLQRSTTMTKRGLLKSTHPFGPFTASEWLGDPSSVRQ
jgi:hypothetical protein